MSGAVDRIVVCAVDVEMVDGFIIDCPKLEGSGL